MTPAPRDDRFADGSLCGGQNCTGRHDTLESGMTYEEISRRGAYNEPCLTVNPRPHAPKRSRRMGITLEQFKDDRAAYLAALERWRHQINRWGQPPARQVDGDLWADYDQYDASGFEVDHPERRQDDGLWHVTY